MGDAVVCPYCGYPTNNYSQPVNPAASDNYANSNPNNYVNGNPNCNPNNYANNYPNNNANNYVNNYPNNNANNYVNNYPNSFSNDYPAIRAFSEKAKATRNISIVAAVLCFGIGFIFSIVTWIRLSGSTPPVITTTNPFEIAEYEAGKRYLGQAKILASIPVFAIALSVVIGFIVGMFSTY